MDHQEAYPIEKSGIDSFYLLTYLLNVVQYVVVRADYCAGDRWFKSRFGLAVSAPPPTSPPTVMGTCIAGSQRRPGLVLATLSRCVLWLWKLVYPYSYQLHGLVARGGTWTLISIDTYFSVCIYSNNKNADKNDDEVCVISETNSMVEEFMLLANIYTAEKTRIEFPHSAVLRRHPTPPESNFHPLIKVAQNKVRLHCVFCSDFRWRSGLAVRHWTCDQ